MHSMAQPAFDTANAVQAALPYGAEDTADGHHRRRCHLRWRQLAQLLTPAPHGTWQLLLLAGFCAKGWHLAFAICLIVLCTKPYTEFAADLAPRPAALGQGSGLAS